jgi:hypothetical protein
MDDDAPEAEENLVGDEKLSFAEAQSMLQKVCASARSLGIDTIHLHLKHSRKTPRKPPLCMTFSRRKIR